jgi:uncharacterized protein (TIGR03083 family)
MTVFDDLGAEQERLAGILGRLDEAQWMSASGAAGWTIADVVLHLAQSEESVVVTAAGGDLRAGLGRADGGTVDERVAALVAAERAAPDLVFARWQRARRAALDALRGADPDRPLEWVAAPVKPATLATTRLAEHWAHGLDITGPLSLEFSRYRPAAACGLAGAPDAAVRDDAGRGAAGAGPVRADRAGRLVGVGVRPGGGRIGHRRAGG